MDITPIYAIVAGGVFCVLVLVRFSSHIAAVGRYVALFTSTHLVYPYLLQRHRIVGPWSRVGVVVQLIYVAVNILCLVCKSLSVSRAGIIFRASTISEAGLRAGALTLVNAIPLFAGLHPAFLADQLGVSLRAVRRLHRSVGFGTFSLAFFHILVIAASRPSFPLNVSRNRFATIVSICSLSGHFRTNNRKGGSALGFLLLLTYPLFRKPSYELFLRIHQALAALFCYSTWRHLPSDHPFPRTYVYISLGLFLFMFILQAISVVIQNGIFHYHLPRADITHSFGAVSVRMRLRKPLKIRDGQYLNLWIPFVSLWSSHPFTVISWAPGEQDTIDILLEPRRGATRELLHYAKGGGTTDRLVMFSGPHGTSVAMVEYETILMVATGFGIAAHLPYLKSLIYNYKARSIRARRIHLVWQIWDRGKLKLYMTPECYNSDKASGRAGSSILTKQCARG